MQFLLVLTISWYVEQYSSQSDFRVLLLASFDLIVGMDWLQAYSPMQIHWKKQKWLAIPYAGSVAVLQGLSPDIPALLLLHIASTDSSSNTPPTLAPLHPAIQELIDSFADIFSIPSSLPPSRACNHQIPLIPGAQPVFIRPYRYPPRLKDEIERQVQEMLSQGLIRPSTSSFSSPVRLVKKKDGSFRFCVDFRHLNALTLKSKFPVPIFDQLTDELANASWFSTLDLRAGFHQILLQSGEEYKTAFETHLGQYEFNVMAFGLTGAPGTMNASLEPGLRKFVLVFFNDILVYSTSFEDHMAHLTMVFQWLRHDQ